MQTIEQKLKSQLGELLFANIALQSQVEQLQKVLEENKNNKESGPKPAKGK